MAMIFDLEVTLTLVKTSQYGVIAKLVIMNNLRYMTLTFDLLPHPQLLHP